MTINEGWLTDPAERYWLETIRRDDFGDGIRAPFAGRNGVSTLYWEPVNHVQDGDVVLHGVDSKGCSYCSPTMKRRQFNDQ